MKRFAAHYIFIPPCEVLKNHFIELDNTNHIRGVFPLEKEIAGAIFLNGVILLSKQEIFPGHFLQLLKEEEQKYPDLSLFQLLDNRNLPGIEKNEPVFLYLLEGTDLPAIKLSINNHQNNSQIRKLC
jgi:hypothetical protein